MPGTLRHNLLAAGSILAFMLAGCKDSGNNPDPDGPVSPFPNIIAIVYPHGGETLYIGDTVEVTWKADTSDTTRLSGIKVCLSTDGGTDYHTDKPLSYQGQIPPNGSYTWIIGTEVWPEIQGQLPSDRCRILLADYQDRELISESGIFSVKRR